MRSTRLRYKYNKSDLGKYIYDMDGYIVNVSPEYYEVKFRYNGNVLKYSNAVGVNAPLPEHYATATQLLTLEEETRHKRSNEKLARHAALYSISTERMHEILFGVDHAKKDGEWMGGLHIPANIKKENKMKLRTRAAMTIVETNVGTWRISDHTPIEEGGYNARVILSDDEIFAAAKFVKDTRKAEQKAKNKRIAADKRETAKRLRRAIAATVKDTKEFKSKLKSLGAR